MRLAAMLVGFALSCMNCLSYSVVAADETAFPLQAKKLLFIGDSITYAGGYVDVIEAQLRLNAVAPLPEVINLGLPSEGVTGLSEEGHPFPRPNVHERLERALEKIQPDVVVACFGVNDGIYAPFDKDRFKAYQQGILELIKKVHAANAKLVLLTPPPFDPLPMKKSGALKPRDAEKFGWTGIYEHYDSEVIQPYGQWIRTLGDQVEVVIDVHQPMTEYVEKKRQENADFTLSGDGIHFDHEGHEVMAAAILKRWGLPVKTISQPELITLVSQRQQLLKNSWLSEVGHLRPGIEIGLPIDEARTAARELDLKIQNIVAGN
ncbi:SGNH/GDSL hydrolase family protein [Planctomicrobium sp. SH668]|uniref:SGNH/GDSL hydrolase family protein n=1 Tax=Planctomicrobium sp. SH668 TaxID=3448126 RepID=UPI003F5B8635